MDPPGAQTRPDTHTHAGLGSPGPPPARPHTQQCLSQQHTVPRTTVSGITVLTTGRRPQRHHETQPKTTVHCGLSTNPASSGSGRVGNGGRGGGGGRLIREWEGGGAEGVYKRTRIYMCRPFADPGPNPGPSAPVVRPRWADGGCAQGSRGFLALWTPKGAHSPSQPPDRVPGG